MGRSGSALRGWREWLAACVCCFLLPLTPAAQAVRSAVSGTVVDQHGAAVAGVRLTLTNLETGGAYGTTTDGEGRYQVTGLPAGPYLARFERENFRTEVREGIQLAVAQTTQIKVMMQVGPITDVLTTSADMPLTEPLTSAVSGVVNERQMRELPLNGRDLFQLALLQPGVTPVPSAGPNPFAKGNQTKAAVNGMRPTWNNVTLDGMDANNPTFNFAPGGTAGVLLGVEAVREFRVLTQTYSAEYGRNAGGIIEAVTRSGGNGFHGSLFELHRNAALDAKNFFDLPGRPIPPFIRHQFGGSAGGPLARERTFFFLGYEGLREWQGETATTTVPNLLAHRGLLPSRANPDGCMTAAPAGCVNVGVDARVRPFLELIPLPNGADFADGTGGLISSDARRTREDYGLVRLDYSRSPGHLIFGRYVVDDSSSRVPYLSTRVPGFPGRQQARNQYFTAQDQKSFGPGRLNELRFGVNRTTMLASVVDVHPGLSISLVAGRPLGSLNIAGLGTVGNNSFLPQGTFSNTFQLQDVFSLTSGRQTLKLGGEARRIHANGPLDFAVNGLYGFQDLSVIGLPSASNNPALEAFLRAQPLFYAGTDPALSDSRRGYRQSAFYAFAQGDVRATRSFTLNAGLRYEYYTNPTEVNGRLSALRDPAADAAPAVGKIIEGTPAALFSPRLGFAWSLSSDAKTVLRGGAGLFRDQIWMGLYASNRSLPPFYKIVTAALPTFLDPLRAAAVGTTTSALVTYRPKFPYVVQYNLNLQRELTPDLVVKAGYLGARANHLTRLVEANPLVPSRRRRANPNFDSILMVLTDAQSSYNALQLSLEKRYRRALAAQLSYTYSKSLDDASGSFPSDAVNEAGKSQDARDRRADRGRSGFDLRHRLVANLIWELPFGPGRRWGNRAHGPARLLVGGWQLAGIADFHSDVPFTPLLGFDNAGTQSVLLADRPDLIGDPYAGACPNGRRAGTVECWFNPGAFALPAPGRFGSAGRNILRGPDFKNVDLALMKRVGWRGERAVEFRCEVFNLANRPNFSVPTNSRRSAIEGGAGDIVFVGRDGGGRGIVPGNAARIFDTVNTPRQIQLGLRLLF